MQNRIGKMTRNVGRNLDRVNRKFSNFTQGAKRAAVAIGVAVAVLSAGLVDMTRAGMAFEQAITNVGAVTLRTRAEIEPLERMALDLGATTKFTATQAAEAMEILARAGFDVQDTLKATPGVLASAAASGLEIAEVADITAKALKGMGLEMDDAIRVADVLTLASSKTNSTMGTLGESLANVAATARRLRVPFEDTVAAIALMQDVGLQPSVAGTAFNTMLTKMAKPSAELAGVMRRIGISFKDAEGNMLPFQQVLEQLSTATKAAGGNFDQVAFLAELVGLRGQKAAANLATLFEEGRIQSLTDALEGAEGSAARMAELRMDTVAGDILLLQSAVNAVKIATFELNSGPLREVIQRTTEWVTANKELIATRVGEFIGKIFDNLEKIISVGKTVLGVVAAFVTLVTVLKTLAAVMTVVNLVMTMNPIGLIIVGVGLLIIAFAALIKKLGGFKKVFGDMAKFTISVWRKVGEVFQSVLGKIAEIAKKVFGGIQKGIDGVAKAAGAVGRFGGKVGGFLGFGGDDDDEDVATATAQAGAEPVIVSPADRVARSIEERRESTSAEVTIRDETGRAEVTAGELGKGLDLQFSGGF